MEELKNIIGKNIACLRAEHKLTQLELAERLNYSDKSISKWERCEAVPDVYVLVQLAEMFSVSVDYLVTSHDNDADQPQESKKAPDEETRFPTGENDRKTTLLRLVISGIWVLSLMLFVGAWIAGHFLPSVFVYTLPVCAVATLVLNSVWRGGRHNPVIVCVLISGILASVYTAFWSCNYWQVFLLAPPSFLIVYLASKLKK